MSPPALNYDILHEIFDILWSYNDPPFSNLALTHSAFRERVNKVRFGTINFMKEGVPVSRIQALVPLLNASVWPQYRRPVNHVRLVIIEAYIREWVVGSDNGPYIDDGSMQATLDIITQNASACTDPTINIIFRGINWIFVEEGFRAALGRFFSCGLIKAIEVSGLTDVPPAFIWAINSPAVKMTSVTTATHDTNTSDLDVSLVLPRTRWLDVSGGSSLSWLASTSGRSALPCLTELHVELRTNNDRSLCSAILSSSGPTLENITLSFTHCRGMDGVEHKFSWPDPSILSNLKHLRLEINPQYTCIPHVRRVHTFADLEENLPPFMPPRLSLAIRINEWLMFDWTLGDLVWMFEHCVRNDTLATTLRKRFGDSKITVTVSLDYLHESELLPHLDWVNDYWIRCVSELCVDLEGIPGCTVDYPVKTEENIGDWMAYQSRDPISSAVGPAILFVSLSPLFCLQPDDLP